jgi:hypothetical protein
MAGDLSCLTYPVGRWPWVEDENDHPKQIDFVGSRSRGWHFSAAGDDQI